MRNLKGHVLGYIIHALDVAGRVCLSDYCQTDKLKEMRKQMLGQMEQRLYDTWPSEEEMKGMVR